MKFIKFISECSIFGKNFKYFFPIITYDLYSLYVHIIYLPRLAEVNPMISKIMMNGDIAADLEKFQLTRCTELDLAFRLRVKVFKSWINYTSMSDIHFECNL